MSDTESWKPVIGHPKYEVSNLGKVRKSASLEIISQSSNTCGYPKVRLHTDRGRYMTRLVHRLVAKAFIENPHSKETVNHIDGDKCNARVDNLEWATRSENQRHAYANGLRTAACVRGENHGRSRLSENDVLIIREMAHDGEQSSVIASHFGISRGHVRDIVKRRNWSHV